MKKETVEVSKRSTAFQRLPALPSSNADGTMGISNFKNNKKQKSSTAISIRLHTKELKSVLDANEYSENMLRKQWKVSLTRNSSMKSRAHVLTFLYKAGILKFPPSLAVFVLLPCVLDDVGKKAFHSSTFSEGHLCRCVAKYSQFCYARPSIEFPFFSVSYRYKCAVFKTVNRQFDWLFLLVAHI